MKLKSISEECNAPHCFFTRSKTNLMIAEILKNAIINGTSRLQEPLKKNNLSILSILDAIKSQECVKVVNYNPDEHNEHLKTISLGPSYLEQQISRAIDKSVEQRTLPQAYVPHIRAEIGLGSQKPKPILRKQKIREEIEKQLQDLPDVHIMIDLPPSRQSEHFSCGATVIQMVAAYYGQNIRESDLIKRLGVTPKSGVKLSKIQQVADEIGLKTHKSKISYDEILQTLEDRVPLVIAILKEDKDYHHFVLAIGHYADGIIFRDPAKFTHSYLPREEFEQRAFGSDGKFLTLAMASNREPEYSSNGVEKT